MKKIIISSLLALLLFTGCGKNMDTPTGKVEEVLSNYQKLDNSVNYDIDRVVERENIENEDDKKVYRAALERQFQNLSYKIKNEEIEGDTATVDVEIEVLDYKSKNEKSKEYFTEHRADFIDEDIVDGKVEEVAEFITYKISELTKVEDKTKYDITFNLTRENDEWVIDDIDDETLEKLLGIY